MRECRECSAKIPNRVIIDGKQRNLKNRKFCLICSPFGKHNTNPDKPLSKRDKINQKYSEFSEDKKKQLILSLYKRGLERNSRRSIITRFCIRDACRNFTGVQ